MKKKEGNFNSRVSTDTPDSGMDSSILVNYASPGIRQGICECQGSVPAGHFPY